MRPVSSVETSHGRFAPKTTSHEHFATCINVSPMVTVADDGEDNGRTDEERCRRLPVVFALRSSFRRPQFLMGKTFNHVATCSGAKRPDHGAKRQNGETA